MSSNWQKPGPNFVPAYQTSGVPFVTSSFSLTEVLCPVAGGTSDASTPIKVQFPFVTKGITIRNTGKNALRVGFSERGIINPGTERLSVLHGSGVKPADEFKNYFIIPASGSAALSGDASLRQTFHFDIRCREIYFISHVDGGDSDPASTKATTATGFSLLAELTTIPAGSFPVLTGSIMGTDSFEGVG